MHSSVRRMTDGAMMIAITAALLLINRFSGGTLLYYFLFLLPLPMVFYSSKYGWKASIAVYVALVLLSFILSSPVTVFYVASEAVLGIVYGTGVHDHTAQHKSIILCMSIAVLINVLDTVLIAALLGYDMPAQIAELRQAMEMMTEKTALSIPAHVNLTQMAAEILIVSAILGGILQGYITHVLSRFMLQRLHFNVEKAKPFLAWFPPKWSGYASLGGYLAYNWTLAHPLTNTSAEYAVQGLGMIGYFYLMIFGWFAITLFMVIRLRIHRRFLAGMISILLCFLLPLLIVTVGFLYIAGNLHNTLMKGNFHAA